KCIRTVRARPIGGRPLPAFGYTGAIRAQSSRHGTTRSISARNCARRVTFVYFSKPVPASVCCERFFIATSCSRVMRLALSKHDTRERERHFQRFPRSVYLGDAGLRITGHTSSGVRVSAMLQGTTDRGRRVILRGPAVYPGRPFEVFDYRSPSRQEHPVGRAPDARWAPVEDVRIGSVPKR